jgi:HPt (histidine-containing phosphotransfer) domain-containing protein
MTDAENLPWMAALLDRDINATLRRMAGKQGYKALLTSFEDNAAVLLNGIADAMAKGDLEAVRDQGHALKGVAGNMGAAALSQEAAIIEHATCLTAAAIALNQLKPVYYDSLDALKKAV